MMRIGKELEKEFERYARTRVHKLRSTFKNIIEKARSEAVHDFRKTTRDLQTIVDMCGICGPSRKVLQIRCQLQRCRHALSEWRDSDVMLDKLKRAQRIARLRGEQQCWNQVAERIAKQRGRTLKKFSRNYKSLRIEATIAKANALVKKRVRSGPMMDNLRLLLQRGWTKWNRSIDDFLFNAAAAELHAVRTKAKTLRYAIDLSQRFYPDNELENASEWLKGIQDRVGAWHDEMTLSESARETFSNSRAPRDTRAIAFLRNIKKEEIAMAESARNFIFSIRTTSEYQRLRRVLSASVYAMTNGDDSAVLATDSITGPIE